MAEYEDYNAVSRIYDEGRRPVGIEVILGAISVGTRKSLGDVHLVDLGCGTGNYTVAMSQYVGRVTGVEFNQGMLAQARQKTTHLSNVELQQGDATQLELPDGFCDAVMINLVLHHVSDVTMVLKECYRILRPKGALIVNTCSGEQLLTMWFLNLIPKACEKATKRFPVVDDLCKDMKEAGFKVSSPIRLSEEFMKQMLNKEGPFSEQWRKSVSVWSLASKEELEAGLAKWRRMLEDNTADQFIAEKEVQRKRLGYTTSIIAYKDSAHLP